MRQMENNKKQQQLVEFLGLWPMAPDKKFFQKGHNRMFLSVIEVRTGHLVFE